jgi:GDP-D-mannose 3',5'-epimerase
VQHAGGREKVPAAFCRKAVVSETEFEVWGDGKQTRSFMFIDDCVEGSIRILLSDCAVPLNLGECCGMTVFWCESYSQRFRIVCNPALLGTDEMIDMNNFARLAMSFSGKNLPIKNIPGPEGVRGRNSDNTMIKVRYCVKYVCIGLNIVCDGGGS